jgi:lipoyl(octanoyl) transferase
MSAAHLLDLPGLTPYGEAFELQRALAEDVKSGARPDTVILLEHEPVITMGRRANEAAELHLPDGVDVEVVETNRGGRSTYHGPGQLVCYPIFDLTRHGQDVKRYCRDLEEALIRTLLPLGVAATRIDGLTGIWVATSLSMSPGARAGSAGVGGPSPPRKIASIGIHISKWVSTHGYALNVDLDPAPFTDWITACGLEDAAFTTVARELGRPVSVEEVRPHAVAALEEVFELELEPLTLEHTQTSRPVRV